MERKHTHTLEIKRDIVAESGRRSDMPTYIQLVYLGHVKMQLVNGAFQFQLASVALDIPNRPNIDVILRLISAVVTQSVLSHKYTNN